MDPQNIKEHQEDEHYEYILAIDLGTNSTSCSFSYSESDNDVQTIRNWPRTSAQFSGGRTPSSVIYKNENEDPLWGGAAAKSFYNENDDFFYAPQIKLYLTDLENQPSLPATLTPIKLVSDYLKQLHKFCVVQMKEYFEEKNKEKEAEELDIPKRDVPQKEHKPKFNVTENKIRYVFSYPDNQGEEYQANIRKALKDAGIISPEDPLSRLKFVTESGATAYYCSTLTHFIKPSPKPYIVCDIGGKVFGLSKIEAKELLETGTISTKIRERGLGYGNLELDNKMKEYLSKKVTTSDGNDELLQKIHSRLFNFFTENIKLTFEGNSDDFYFSLDELPDISSSSIKSDWLQDDAIVFNSDEIKRYVFDPVTDNILNCIDDAKKEIESGIKGIILSGNIGSDKYLEKLVYNKFGSAEIKVTSIKDSTFAVSRGLCHYGLRQLSLMIPYFDKKEVRQKDKVMQPGNEIPVFDKTYDGVKTINLNGVDFIIGLDFGTTYSGFAYAPVAKDGSTQNQNHTLIIKEIKSWPKQTNGNYPKVPSLLYYDENMKYKKLFGHEAKRESNKRNANGILLRHFKLLLSREFDPEVDDKVIKNLDDNTIINAITNYIRDFAKEGISRMKRMVSVNEKNLAFVVTVPAMWSDEAKNTMRVAVRNANLFEAKNGASIDDDKLVFITEAEAAALYCEKYYKDKFSMDRQQRFMICDAGGGTVDLVTFEVGQEENDEKKLLINEITSGDGDNCGSAYLDQKFKEYIVDKFLECNISYEDKGIENLVNQFVQEIKPNFEPAVDPDMEEEITLSIPTVLGIPPDVNDEHGFIVDNEIVISYSEMETRVFTPVVDKVLALIEKQLRKLPEGERQLDAILMVGGFGQSVYLHKKVVDCFENRAIGARFVGKPPDGDLAICRGAASFGLEPRMVSDGITRYTYGLQVKDVFRREQDNIEQRVEYKDEQGQSHYYCQNVFSEIVARETKISKGTLYSLKTFVTYPNDPIFAIYSSEDKDDSMDKRDLIASDLEPICKLTANLHKIPGIEGKKTGDRIDFEVLVEITGIDILVHILYEGKRVTDGVTTANTVVKTKFKLDLTEKEKKKKKKSWLSIPVFSLSGKGA